MANLLLDDSGRPKPQVENAAGTGFEPWKGENNAGRITGDVDHDAVDTGKPVKIGGKASATKPAAVAVGDRVNAWLDEYGQLHIIVEAGANIIGKVGIDQTTPGTTNGVQVVAALPAGTNNIGDVDVLSSALPTGASTSAKQDTIIGYIDGLETLLIAIKDIDGIKKIIDPLPATNEAGTALASAARTTTTNSSDLPNAHKNGVHVILDVTAITGAPSVTLKIEGKDPASGKYYTVLEGAAVTAVSTVVYKVFPAATAAANSVANDIIPKIWRITITHANADSITYSVGYSLM